MAHIYAGHYWSYEYALLFSFFRPEQDKLPTRAQVDTFTAEFKCLSDEEVQELVEDLRDDGDWLRQAATFRIPEFSNWLYNSSIR